MKKILINGNSYTSSYFLDFPEKYDVISKININSDFKELSEKYSVIINFYEVSSGDFLEIYQENFLYVKDLVEKCNQYNIKFIQISTGDVYNRIHKWEENTEDSDKLNLHNDYLLSKRVCEKFLQTQDCLILRIKNSFDSRYHPDNWLIKAYSGKKISNMIDTFTYIPDLKKIIEEFTEKNKKGLYNVVQQESGSALYFFSSMFKTAKFSYLDPHMPEHEDILHFKNDDSILCSDVNCTKLLNEFSGLTNLKAAMLLSWENLKNKLDTSEN